MAKDILPIPSPEDMFLRVPLYSGYHIFDWSYEAVIRIEFFQGTLDAYCSECGRESVFACTTILPAIETSHCLFEQLYSIDELLQAGSAWLPSIYEKNEITQGTVQTNLKDYTKRDKYFVVKFQCKRNKIHELHFCFLVKNSEIVKIGQYPSLADLQTDVLKKYRGILGEQKYKEFRRATGLNAHGIGIGSFVYLRRIFEALIEESHIEAQNESSWDEGEYQRGRMEERIDLLKSRLPDFLVKNKNLYSILSKGIHELSEDECLKYFPLVLTGIELILDEKLVALEKQEKMQHAEKAIAVITGEIRQK